MPKGGYLLQIPPKSCELKRKSKFMKIERICDDVAQPPFWILADAKIKT